MGHRIKHRRCPPKVSIRKHRMLGRLTKGPKMRHYMKREAEKNERKAPESTCVYSSIADAMKDRRSPTPKHR